MIDEDLSVNSLQKKAIEAAISCQWEQALSLNQQLIDLEPENVESLNRLAKAHFELGHYSDSKKIYQKVLELDPYNTIAEKNIKRLGSFKANGTNHTSNNHQPITISPALFVQEPGITKSVTLIKVAEPQKIILLSAGQPVNLVVKSRGISVTDSHNQYIGALPDDVSFHLLKLINGGNRYNAYIKSAKANSVVILIREMFRSKRFKNQASFLDNTKTLSYSSDHITLLSENDDSSDEGEESEEIVP